MCFNNFISLHPFYFRGVASTFPGKINFHKETQKSEEKQSEVPQVPTFKGSLVNPLFEQRLGIEIPNLHGCNHLVQ